MIDLTGQRFGRWLVLKRAKSIKRNMYWTCQCECGTIRDVKSCGMNLGKSRSCGCLRKYNIIGKKFGFLIVIRDLGVKRTFTSSKAHRVFLCRCDCGAEKEVMASAIGRGTKSCGCHNKKMILSHTLPQGVSSFNELYAKYKRAAKKRNFEFTLTKEEFSTLTLSNCHYCGIEPRQITQSSTYGKTPYTYNGVDRLDNCTGYITNNVVPCCGICNRAKHSMPLEEFLEWLDRLVKFRITESDATASEKNNVVLFENPV